MCSLTRTFNEMMRSASQGDLLFSGRAQGPASTSKIVATVGAGPCARPHAKVFHEMLGLVKEVCDSQYLPI